jgi:tetratricopeptide (TPR) repeat protein
MALLYRTRYRLALELPQPDQAGALADLQAILDLDGVEPAAKARAARERGHLFFRNGRLTEALSAYDQAIALQKTDAEPRRWRAEVLLRLKRYEEAAAEFDRYLAGGGKPAAGVYRGRALARVQLGQRQQALEDFTLALGLSPADAALREQRGRTYLACSAHQLAAADFDEAIKLDPKRVHSYQGRALARMQLNRPREAAEDAERAAELARDDGKVLYVVAGVLAQAGEQLGKDRTQRERYQERALALLRRTMELLPEGQRPAFWRETVRRDPAIRPLSASEGYLRLDRRHGRPRATPTE